MHGISLLPRLLSLVLDLPPTLAVSSGHACNVIAGCPPCWTAQPCWLAFLRPHEVLSQPRHMSAWWFCKGCSAGPATTRMHTCESLHPHVVVHDSHLLHDVSTKVRCLHMMVATPRCIACTVPRSTPMSICTGHSDGILALTAYTAAAITRALVCWCLLAVPSELAVLRRSSYQFPATGSAG